MPTALSPITNRRPRFLRVETPPPFQLTQRDFVIVGAVARFRFLTSDQIARFVAGSQQPILRRLQLLFHHGYLDRPRSQKIQLAHVLDDGNRPFVYGIGKRGAQLLAEAGAAISDKLDWTQKNQRATAQFLAHTVETAETMIAFDLACRVHGVVRLVDQHELVPYLPEATRAQSHPFRCRVTLRVKELPLPLIIGVVPDRLFSLMLGDDTRNNFALELDRGTMDITSRRLIGKSSFRRKLLGYWELWKSDRHTERWGFKSFRVLTATPSEKRLQNMIAAQREIVGTAGSNLFLFTTPERLAAQNPLGKVWISGKGEEVSLVA
jgi:protein involved in plasmid replication-relaxation